jgi:hypothetical protein
VGSWSIIVAIGWVGILDIIAKPVSFFKCINFSGYTLYEESPQ